VINAHPTYKVMGGSANGPGLNPFEKKKEGKYDKNIDHQKNSLHIFDALFL